MDISRISIGRNVPYDINVIIEIPQGGEPARYELDKDSGAMFVDRFLHTAMFYPANRLHGGWAHASGSGGGDALAPNRRAPEAWRARMQANLGFAPAV